MEASHSESIRSATNTRRAIRMRTDLQSYHDREYVQHFLDEAHFDALNALDSAQACCLSMTTAGCLDARDLVPAGSMCSFNDNTFGITHSVRGLDVEELARRDRIAGLLIDALIQEMADEISKGP